MRPKYQIDLYAGCPNDLLSLSFGAPKGLHLKKYIYQYFIHTGKAQKADLSKINNIFPKLAFFFNFILKTSIIFARVGCQILMVLIVPVIK